jgi:hypothetical protein
VVAVQAGFHTLAGRDVPRLLVANRGLLAPGFAIATRSTDRALAAVAQAAHDFAGAPDPSHEARLAERMADWASDLRLAPGQGLLVAEADLAGGLPGRARQPDYGIAPRIALHLARALRARFGEGLDLRLLYLTQEAGPWLADLHWILARQSNLTVPAERFCRDHAALARFDAVLAAIAGAVSGAVPGARVETAAVDGPAARLGPGEALLQLAGLAAEARAALRPAPVEDPRPPYDLADAFVALNRAHIPPDALKRLKLALLASAELDRDLQGTQR